MRSFNGAAVVRPRRSAPLRADRCRGSGLQRSRGRETAEITVPDAGTASRTSLQRSRGRETAEIDIDRDVRRHRRGFNGAAVVRPRR